MRAKMQGRAGAGRNHSLGEQIRRAEEGMGLPPPSPKSGRAHNHTRDELQQQAKSAQQTRETILREAAMAAALSAGIFDTEPNPEAVAMRTQIQRRRRGRSDLSEQIAAVERELGMQGGELRANLAKNEPPKAPSETTERCRTTEVKKSEAFLASEQVPLALSIGEEEDEAALHLHRLLKSAEWVEQAMSWPPLMAIRLKILARLQGGLALHLARWKAGVLLAVWGTLPDELATPDHRIK